MKGVYEVHGVKFPAVVKVFNSNKSAWEEAEVMGISSEGMAVDCDGQLWAAWRTIQPKTKQLIDPKRLLGKVLWRDGEPHKIISMVQHEEIVQTWHKKGCQWSDTVDDEPRSFLVEGETK